MQSKPGITSFCDSRKSILFFFFHFTSNINQSHSNIHCIRTWIIYESGKGTGEGHREGIHQKI